jgi:hypothetical protein
MQLIQRTVLVLALLFMLVTLLAISSGPPVQTTGAPRLGTFAAERTCSQPNCHIGSPINSGGQLEILGLPETYVPGTNYPLTLRLTSSQSAQSPRWGFELTCARLSDGVGGGTLFPSGLNENLVNSRTYVSQNVSHLYAGEHGSVEWQVSWTAPDTSEGPVGFYACGNASNGNFLAGAGDLIYTVGETTQAGLVPVERVTWGRLKSRAFAAHP